MQKVIRFFNLVFQRYTPDPFAIAALLTLLVLMLGSFFTSSTPIDMISYWGDGFWKIIAFTLQMVMILVGGYIIAVSSPVQILLRKLVKKVSTPSQAIVIVTVISCLASWLNWGFGLVVGAFVAIELARNIPNINFKVLVASSYTGFIVWHGGLSGSIPLVVNTDGNFSANLIGQSLSIEHTLFSTFNIVTLASLFVFLPLINWQLLKWQGETTSEQKFKSPVKNSPTNKEEFKDNSPAEKLERSPFLTIGLTIMAIVYIGTLIYRNEFQLNLNKMNFLFFFTGLALHGHPKSFIRAAIESSEKVGPLLIQYPLYAGIMAMIASSGLAANISEFFISISTQKTFPLWTFISAGLVNIFVPSGGGQWAIQAPIVIPAAKALGVDMGKAIMAVAWGDAWTNLAQPFWALPVLAIAGLKVRDIMGHCILVLISSGILISLLLYII